MSIASKQKMLARCQAELEKIRQAESRVASEFAITPKRLEKKASRTGCFAKARRGMHGRRVARTQQLTRSRIRLQAKIKHLEGEIAGSGCRLAGESQ